MVEQFPSIEHASVYFDDDCIVAFVVVESSPMYVSKHHSEYTIMGSMGTYLELVLA